MNDNTLNIVDETRVMRAMRGDVKSMSEKSARIQERCKRVCNAHLQHIFGETEVLADNNEFRNLYKNSAPLLKPFSSRTWAIENTQGETVTEWKAISEMWKEYYESWFENPQVNCFTTAEPTSEKMEPYIFKQEMRATIIYFILRKATWRHAIPGEIIKLRALSCFVTCV